MMGKSQQLEAKLFYHGLSIERRIPQDHVLRKIKQHIDFNFIRSRVEHLYGNNGHVSVDPAVVLKLIFLSFYYNVKSERALMEQLPMRLDWLWFCGYDLDHQTPDHSVISKARNRWGIDVFTDFFSNILKQCIDAGLVDGKTIHVDSSLIAANAAQDGLKPHLRLLGQNLYNQLDEDQMRENANKKNNVSDGLVNDTDPDARLTRKNGRATLGYKDHRVVDDNCGIITATITTAANTHDAHILKQAIETHQANVGEQVKTLAADKAYGTIDNYKYLHDNHIHACVPHQKFNQHGGLPHENFIYDKTRDCYVCPANQILKRHPHGKFSRYRSNKEVCRTCIFFTQCITSKTGFRDIQRNIDAHYIEWADACMSRYQRKRLLSRRQIRAEGSFADAANNHGFKRARWRGLFKIRMQNLMIAATQNLRKLLRHVGSPGGSAASVMPLQRHIFCGFEFKSINATLLETVCERILTF